VPHTPPTYYPWFDHPTTFGEKYKSWSSSLCNFLHSPAISSLLDPINYLSLSFHQWALKQSKRINTHTHTHTHKPHQWWLGGKYSNIPRQDRSGSNTPVNRLNWMTELFTETIAHPHDKYANLNNKKAKIKTNRRCVCIQWPPIAGVAKKI
jgi:hypothetical protein